MNHVVELALFLHLLAVVVWVGGMFFAHLCLRPAVADIAPQMRMPLWLGVLHRFFTWVAVCIGVILISGGFLMSRFGGGGQSPWPVQAMTGFGVMMMLIFGHLRFALFPRLRRAVQAEKWQDGAKALAGIRMMVTINLVLGVCTIAFGVLGLV